MVESLNIELKSLRKQVKEYKKIGEVNMVIRIKAIIAFLTNKPIKTIAQCFDISEKTVRRWIKEYKKNGIDGLKIKSRSGRPPKLDQEELNILKSMIQKDNERVWVARHIFNLIFVIFSVAYSVKYLPEVLKRAGLSFHKAVHYLSRRNEDKRSKWIKEKLPEIYREHIENGWRIFYQDEVGFQTEGTLAYTWAPKGEEVQVKNKGRHGRVNLMGVYEVGSGDFFYKQTFLKVTALRFKRFLCCLKKKYRTDKFIIIADNASFHKAKWFTAWWEKTQWLQLEFLPAYSPDFNPIERLWKWIKKEYTHNKCWASKESLSKHLSIKLREMILDANAYIGTMRKELLRLKAAFDYYNTPFIWDLYLPEVA